MYHYFDISRYFKILFQRNIKIVRHVLILIYYHYFDIILIVCYHLGVIPYFRVCRYFDIIPCSFELLYIVITYYIVIFRTLSRPLRNFNLDFFFLITPTLWIVVAA